MKTAFVTLYCTHYRVKTYEMLAGYCNVDFYFYSEGKEWYWLQKLGVQSGNFNYEYLPGIRICNTRITLTLPWKLLRGNYDVYIKCINGRFALPITYLIARLRRKPFILWTGIWMRLQTPFHRLVFPLTRYIYRHADAIAVYGEHVKRYLVSEGVLPERIFVAAHAMDNASYRRPVSQNEIDSLRARLGLNPTQKVILYMGRLVPEKGLVYLIEAFAALKRKDVVLVLAGEGSERSTLERLVQEREIGRSVLFAGYVPPEQALCFYALSWVFILPSITTQLFKEPWGQVVNEAMNQGVPVIATDAVGAVAGGLVQDGINGFVVTERDSKSLAASMIRILDDAELRHWFGQNAKQTIASWTNERMVLGFRQAIDYVLKHHGSVE